MPTAAITVDSTVPSVRMWSTLMPLASANLGFEPAADIAMPILLRENSHITPQHSRKNSKSPVGTVAPKISNDRKLSSRWPKLPSRLCVTRRPWPDSSQMIFVFVNGSSIQPMHISDTNEKPT